MADEPNPPNPPTPPPPDPASSGNATPSAASVVLDGRERELTTRISELEDQFDTEKKRREETEKENAELRKQVETPVRKKGVLESFNDWWEGKDE